MSLKSRTLPVLLPLFCVFGLLLFSGTPAFAQSASVSGRVIDPSSAVVRKAQITLIDVAKGTSQTTQTNGGGFYSLPFVQPGIYTLAVESSGFKRFERTKITVETAQSLVVDVRLQVGDVSQSVTVDGSGAQINTTDASVSTVIDRQFVENIPLNGRSFQSLLTMIPGVSVVPSQGAGQSGEFTVNGQRTEANYFTVDGVSANTGAYTSGWGGFGLGAGYSGSTPSESALGTTQSLVSIDALQEFRATTSTYSAEYGRTPGGQFTFQTRSGTEDWHGSLFDYFRNDALDANNYFNKRTSPITSRQAERQNDFGGTIGGPLPIPGLYSKDNPTFFFFSYEGLRLRIPQAATASEVPTLALRAQAPAQIQPFLNAFPKPSPNGKDYSNGLADFIGGYSAPSSIDASSIRLDHHFGNNFQIFGRYSDTPSDSQSRPSSITQADMAVVNTQSVAVKSLTLGATNTFTPSFTNDFRFNFTWNRGSFDTTTDNYGGATPLSSDVLNAIPGYQQGRTLRFDLGYGDFFPTLLLTPQSNDQRQINITDTASFLVGRHSLKWGIDYRRLLTIGSIPAIMQSAIYHSEDAVIANQTEVDVNSGPTVMKPVYSNFSAFLQDEWKPTTRLSLSLGVRWELNPAPKDADGNNPYGITSTNLATVQLAPKNTPLWQTTYANFAPRFGMAYQVHQQPGHETVVRAGAGIFYDTGNTTFASYGYQSQGLATSYSFSPASFPLTQVQLDSVPPPNTETPYTTIQVYGFDPHLSLPYAWQWNLAVEQAFGSQQTVTVSYVGSAGRRLLTSLFYYPDNPAFGPNGVGLQLITNDSTSDYDALQVQYQRKMSHGFQALASYTWSHAIDDATTNSSLLEIIRADSDNDIRNNFQLGLTYRFTHGYANKLLNATANGWSVDARVSARSALPVDVIGPYVQLPDSGEFIRYQPNRVPGVPLYLHDPSAPGGRVINFAAYSIAKDNAGNNIQGNAGRNSARGFGASQADVALNREFSLRENVHLQFRAEAFNLFNQSLMGTIYNTLSSGAGKFGYAYKTENYQLGSLNSLYQVGGPRSLQLALRLHF